MSSFVSILIPSASGSSNPNGPIRFGPGRYCTRPSTFRSTSVSMANRLANTMMMAAIASRLLTSQRNDSGRKPVSQSRAMMGNRSKAESDLVATSVNEWNVSRVIHSLTLVAKMKTDAALIELASEKKRTRTSNENDFSDERISERSRDHGRALRSGLGSNRSTLGERAYYRSGDSCGRRRGLGSLRARRGGRLRCGGRRSGGGLRSRSGGSCVGGWLGSGGFSGSTAGRSCGGSRSGGLGGSGFRGSSDLCLLLGHFPFSGQSCVDLGCFGGMDGVVI